MPRTLPAAMSSQDFRALRLSAGCTQLEWSRLVRCTPSHVANIENGQCPPGKFLAERAQAAAKRVTKRVPKRTAGEET